MNPLEILEVRLFEDDALPQNIGMGIAEMIENARSGDTFWE